jgi:hypothetical protein
MGIFSRKRSDGQISVDWSPHTSPENPDERKSRLTLKSPMLEREPSRMDDYITFTYLDLLPECKGIVEERLIACGPSTLFFSDKSQPATAFLTDQRIVHLGTHNGMNAAIGSFHDNLLGLRPEGTWEVTVNWQDPRCPVLGFGPRFGRDGKQNRFAMEWWYSFSQLAEERFA